MSAYLPITAGAAKRAQAFGKSTGLASILWAAAFGVWRGANLFFQNLPAAPQCLFWVAVFFYLVYLAYTFVRACIDHAAVVQQSQAVEWNALDLGGQNADPALAPEPASPGFDRMALAGAVGG